MVQLFLLLIFVLVGQCSFGCNKTEYNQEINLTFAEQWQMFFDISSEQFGENIERIKIFFQQDSEKVNNIDQAGRTILHYAVIFEKYDLVLWLLEHNANPFIFDHDGNAPLHYFEDQGALTLLLKQYPHSLCVKNRKQQTLQNILIAKRDWVTQHAPERKEKLNSLIQYIEKGLEFYKKHIEMILEYPW